MKCLMFWVSLISLSIISMGSQPLARPSVEDDEQATARKQSAKNLTQLVMAMHKCQLKYRSLPPHAIYDETGKKALLSWRVGMLLFLEQEKLYNRFKLDEPWDSPHNKELLKEMPKVFEMPGVKSEIGMTYYQVFTMPINLPAGKKGLFMPIFPLAKRAVTLGQITAKDGTSNTICIAEAATPVEWTKPSDLLLEHDDAPLPKLGIRPSTDEFLVAFADGSVHEIRKKIDDMDKHTRVMKQLIGWKDGSRVEKSAVVK